MVVRLVREFRFEAAHRLTRVSSEHRCGRLHGHSYRVELALRGPMDVQAGWLIDFGDIDQVWNPIRDRLDHAVLNDLEGLENPTCENLTKWLWDEVKPKLLQLERVTVWETADARCEYEGG